MRILTAAEMRSCDKYTFETIAVPSRAVMEVAGRVVAERALQIAGEIGESNVTILAGAGNNGGDGYVAARHLAGAGLSVKVIGTTAPASLSGDALLAFDSWTNAGGLTEQWLPDSESAGTPFPFERGLLIDALFGTGYSRPMDAKLAEFVEQSNAARNTGTYYVLSIDIPSGVVADSGHIFNSAIQADETLALQSLKPAHLLPHGRERCGDVFVADLGVSLDGLDATSPHRKLIDASAARELLLRIRSSAYAHKGTRGHVVIVGGFPGKTGAVVLSGMASLRAGAGLATAAVSESSFDALQPQLRELMGEPLPVRKGEAAVRSTFQRLLEGKDAVVAGPGLGTDEEAHLTLRMLVEEVKRRHLPLLLDADALNLIARDDVLRRKLPDGVILTPHPGEMARLRRKTVAEGEAARIEEASSLASDLRGVVVLKGANTIVATADGSITVGPHAVSALATGGSGDVLSGIIGAYVASGLSASEACSLGVFLHGQAGADLSGGIAGGGVGALAHEIADALPALSTALISTGSSPRQSFLRPVLPPPLVTGVEL